MSAGAGESEREVSIHEAREVIKRQRKDHSGGLGLVALGSVELPAACEKHYPKCCSYHQGWDDAFSLLRKVGNLLDGQVYWNVDPEDAERMALFVIEVERGSVL